MGFAVYKFWGSHSLWVNLLALSSWFLYWLYQLWRKRVTKRFETSRKAWECLQNMKQRNNPFKLDKSCAEHGVLNSEYHDVRKTVHNSIKKKTCVCYHYIFLGTYSTKRNSLWFPWFEYVTRARAHGSYPWFLPKRTNRPGHMHNPPTHGLVKSGPWPILDDSFQLKLISCLFFSYCLGFLIKSYDLNCY